MKFHKISFCIVCMNRLDHLKATLLENIRNNVDYPAAEFILLDYNSVDGLEDYIQHHLMTEIEEGNLIYYKTDQPKFFLRSHSRNLAFKLASGELICNLDADNFTGKGFAAFINRNFNEQDGIFLTAPLKENITGRIVVRKEDFMAIGGYDENMRDYGFEDYDLTSRLERAGLINIKIELEDFLRALPHSNGSRINNEYLKKNLSKCLVNYQSPSASEVLFLLNNGNFIKALLRSKRTEHSEEMFRLKLDPTFIKDDLQIVEGDWTDRGTVLHLNSEENKEDSIVHDGDLRFSSYKNGVKKNYYDLTARSSVVNEAIQFFNEQNNKNKWIENNESGIIKVNGGSFGKSMVYENFCSTNLKEVQ